MPFIKVDEKKRIEEAIKNNPEYAKEIETAQKKYDEEKERIKMIKDCNGKEIHIGSRIEVIKIGSRTTGMMGTVKKISDDGAIFIVYDNTQPPLPALGSHNDYNLKVIEEPKLIEFNLYGSLYTGDKTVTLDDFLNVFNEFCDNKGWEFCGGLRPLVNGSEE